MEILEKRKHDEVCFRTDKKFSQKKIQNKKQTVFVWTHFFFDNDLNNLYFELLFYYNNTKTGTNWCTFLLPSLNRHSSLRNLYFSPLYILNTISHTPKADYLYSFTLYRYDTLLQRNTCVLGENKPITTLASLENKPKKK